MKFPLKRNYKLDFETALGELYLIHKDLKSHLMNDESFNNYFSYLFEFAYQKILDRNKLKDTDVVREQFSNILAQEVNDLYKAEYVIPNSNSQKELIREHISDKNIYFHMDEKTKEGIEFFIVKDWEFDELIFVTELYTVDKKFEKFVQGWN
jgi:hypothetical protein